MYERHIREILFFGEEEMTFRIFCGLLLPFVGTLAGCGCVFFMRDRMSERIKSILLGFAGGVMTAASVWSLLIPAMEHSKAMGRAAFLPATVGFLLGVGFLLALEWAMPRFGSGNGSNKRKLSRTGKLVLAVGLHNVPEGMAVGAVFAGLLSGNTGITSAGAIGLAAGIAIQNIPEGAIVSMPLKTEGRGKLYSFSAGVLSGVVEPIGAFVTLYAVSMLLPVLPYLLGFAAGAMIYVVINDLVPEMSNGDYPKLGAAMFAIGFSTMMMLDVALG